MRNKPYDPAHSCHKYWTNLQSHVGNQTSVKILHRNIHSGLLDTILDVSAWF